MCRFASYEHKFTRCKFTRYTLILLAFVGVALPLPVEAEPYLALRSGLSCAQCHTDPSGGGQRKAFAYDWAQATLVDQESFQGLITTMAESKITQWRGDVVGPLRIGGNIRSGLRATHFSESEAENDDASSFETNRSLLYLSLALLPEQLFFYADERLGPGGAVNRETFALLQSTDGRYYVKSGRFFLPYGWRLEDDGALIRSFPGINFTNADDGIEVGYLDAAWQAQLAVTNGEGGAGESNQGKQYSGRVELIQPVWRIGASLNRNDGSGGDRDMANLFAGLRTGPVVWLAEADWVRDRRPGVDDLTTSIYFLEANLEVRQGINLKMTAERQESDAEDDNALARYSAVLEWFPLPFSQLRLGVSSRDDEKVINTFNNDELFIETNLYF